MSTYTRPRLATVVLRWLLGTTLVSWRYMWQTTPLHRVESRDDGIEGPPGIPPEVMDDQVQLPEDGAGRLFHRRFRVRITDTTCTAAELMRDVIRDFTHFVPSEVVGVRRLGSPGDELKLGDEFVIEMPGPWDGPVRVVHVDDTCLRLATLQGHLEAGQVQFQARRVDSELTFEIEAWARPSTPVVHLLYSYLRLAKEIQLNMWVRFCRAAAVTAGGRPADGIHITTQVGSR